MRNVWRGQIFLKWEFDKADMQLQKLEPLAENEIYKIGLYHITRIKTDTK